jgi:hypothetical protein
MKKQKQNKTKQNKAVKLSELQFIGSGSGRRIKKNNKNNNNLPKKYE